ncbi:MAG: hypothetical protein CMM12_09415 [Rhodospirillaceae bacterium]|nr:hypothetical protein [Rhodospirillaceae bacterium]
MCNVATNHELGRSSSFSHGRTGGIAESGLKRVLDLDKAIATNFLVLRHPVHRDTARMRAFSEFVSGRLAHRL